MEPGAGAVLHEMTENRGQRLPEFAAKPSAQGSQLPPDCSVAATAAR